MVAIPRRPFVTEYSIVWLCICHFLFLIKVIYLSRPQIFVLTANWEATFLKMLVSNVMWRKSFTSFSSVTLERRMCTRLPVFVYMTTCAHVCVCVHVCIWERENFSRSVCLSPVPWLWVGLVFYRLYLLLHNTVSVWDTLAATTLSTIPSFITSKITFKQRDKPQP